MDQETKQQLLSLLQETQVAALAVVVDGAPYTGLVPFVLRADNRAVWIHVSTLARHTRGLEQDGRFSLLIQAPTADNPLETVRVSIQGTADLLQKDSTEYMLARKTYSAKYPQSAMLFSFQDFYLFELRIEKGRYVAGFAKAFNLSPEGLESLGPNG